MKTNKSRTSLLNYRIKLGSLNLTLFDGISDLSCRKNILTTNTPKFAESRTLALLIIDTVSGKLI